MNTDYLTLLMFLLIVCVLVKLTAQDTDISFFLYSEQEHFVFRWNKKEKASTSDNAGSFVE